MLDEETKTMVVMRLIEKGAKCWWEGLKKNVTATWRESLEEYHDKSYTKFYRDQKRKEFFSLRQDTKTVLEYERKLRKLSLFVPELVDNEEYLSFKLQSGLNFDIQEIVSKSNFHTYQEALHLALKVETMLMEKRRVREKESQSERSLGGNVGQETKKRKNMASCKGNKTRVGLVGSSQDQQVHKASNFAPSTTLGAHPPWKTKRECGNCKKIHVGACNEPMRCYCCQQVGHLKRNCPRLKGDGGSTQALNEKRDMVMTSQAQNVTPLTYLRSEPTTKNNTIGVHILQSQTQTQTRPNVMIQEDTHQNPKTIGGNLYTIKV